MKINFSSIEDEEGWYSSKVRISDVNKDWASKAKAKAKVFISRMNNFEVMIQRKGNLLEKYVLLLNMFLTKHVKVI